MHARAGLIAALAALAALAGCGSRSRPPVDERPGLDGLIAHLAAVRAGALSAWPVPAADWPGLVTAPYRDHHAAYAAHFAPPALGPGPITARVQYADDATLAPAQRRERIALPVGRPGTIASIAGVDVPAVFVFDRGRWRALAGVDALTRAAIAAREPACAAAYAAAAAGPCMDAAAPAALAALDGSADDLARACRRLRALGCGSVAAPP